MQKLLAFWRSIWSDVLASLGWIALTLYPVGAVGRPEDSDFLIGSAGMILIILLPAGTDDPTRGLGRTVSVLSTMVVLAGVLAYCIGAFEKRPLLVRTGAGCCAAFVLTCLAIRVLRGARA